MEEKNVINTQEEFNGKLSYTHDQSMSNVTLTNYVITCQIDFPTNINLIRLSYCEFQKSVEFKGSVNLDANFYDCTFRDIRLLNTEFNGKTRFRECNFYKTTFDNTSFNELADFWSSTFHEEVIFYKVDFFKTTVFSDCTFNKNALFTYTVIDSKLILRQATFDKGIDLALSIIGGDLVLFDLQLNTFKSINRTLTAEEYAFEIKVGGKIPLKNKRETFRILYHHFKTLGNTKDAIKFKTFERDSIKREAIEHAIYPAVQPLRFLKKTVRQNQHLLVFKRSKLYKIILQGIIYIKKIQFFELLTIIKDYISNLFDLLVLALNKISNNHGKSYMYGIIFTFVMAGIFFNLSIINTESYKLVDSIWDIKWSNFEEVSPFFWQSLIPTHKFSYMDDLSPNNKFYRYDLIGRIFIGYGIYQTIQAFRKYK
ncbi:pentapeptide repeat-containing protein [uncultured Christiangramia sp.]|uniref:pentapeptide repeat-containing protein n=1 Tax=uncultured Christiangramia sp. TaxID=503836 RepID=UPI00261919F0|nr:pentapeptide repeat-containing protein [uncultured Christiangramia sp.]